MLRLETTVSAYDFFRFHKSIELNSYVDCYVRGGFSDYRYNYSVKESITLKNPFTNSDDLITNCFWFAYMHNMEKQTSNDYTKYKLVLEFNPNKCTIVGILHKVLILFFSNLDRVYIKSCDVAFDIPVHIDNFIVDKGYKHYTCDIVQNDGHTMYFGSPGSDGRIKIYNKAAEQKVNYDWTRWEISLKFKDTLVSQVLACRFDFNFNPPEVLYYDSLNLEDFDVKMKCYIYSIQNGFVKLDDFSKDIRKKIKSQLATVTSVKKIDVNKKCDVYNTIVSYFIGFVKSFNNNFSEDIAKIEEIFNKKAPCFKVLKGKQLSINYIN